MSAADRQVYCPLSLARYRGPDGQHCVLVASGPRWLRLLALDSGGLTVRRVPTAEARYLAPLCTKDEAGYQRYRAALRRFGSAARAFGATKEARGMLRDARCGLRSEPGPQ